jgi:Domain of unknown function (DUF222)
VGPDTFIFMKNELAERVDRVDVETVDDVTMLAELAGLEPGPLAMMVLTGIDPATLDDDGRLDYAREWDRQQRWAAARTQSALAEVMVCDLPDDESEIGETLEYRALMVATALQWPPRGAMGRLDLATRLVYELTGTYALLSAGQLSLRHATVMVEETEGLDQISIALVEARVLEGSVEQTAAEFGRSVRKAVLAVAPLVAQIQHASALAGRNVRRASGRDGMATLVATLTAADAETVYLALDAIARKAAAADGDITIGLDARRADALVAWALAALADPTLPKQHGRPVSLRLSIDLPSLLGLADNPAELGHYGVIPASVARALAADANWQRLVTEPVTGFLLDFGTTVYRPPQELRDFLIARDRVCRFPGCSMAAERCDLDHCCPYDKGGHTAACNCHALCRRHHIAKTTGGWLLRCNGKGGVTWVAPTGQQFFVQAENHNAAL